MSHSDKKKTGRWRGLLRKVRYIDKVTAFLIPSQQDALGAPEHHARKVILFGFWMAVLVFGVFGLWSVLAPLDSAAIAPGQVVVDSNRKTITHLEGGIVEAILVSDGQIVEKNAPMIRLREIQARAQVDMLRTQFLNSLAIEARLIAERDGGKAPKFPEEMAEYGTADAITAIKAGQISIFNSRTKNIHGQVEMLEARIAQHKQEIRGLEMQEKAMSKQITLLEEEIVMVEKLVEEAEKLAEA